MTPDAEPRLLSARALLDAHRAVFLDAYGVLVDAQGALPHAAAFLAALEARGVPFFVLTNDASRLATTSSRRFRALGLPVPPERVVSSGELLAPCFAARGLAGARCVVLGSEDGAEHVRRAGGEVIAATGEGGLDALVIIDDSGFLSLEVVERVLAMLFRTLEDGGRPALLVPNPDLIYPKSPGRYGLAAGSLAPMIEAALALRFPDAPRAEYLGKPHAPLFDEAVRRAGTADAVMIGDQLHTDVLGAARAGLASALVGTGLTRLEDARAAAVRPTYLLRSLALDA